MNIRNFKITATALLLATSVAFTGCKNSDKIKVQKEIDANTLNNAYLYKEDKESDYKLVAIYKISPNFFRINDLYYYIDYNENNENNCLQNDPNYQVINYQENPFKTLDKLNSTYYSIKDELEFEFGKKSTYSKNEINDIVEKIINEKNKPDYYYLRLTRYKNLLETKNK